MQFSYSHHSYEILFMGLIVVVASFGILAFRGYLQASWSKAVPVVLLSLAAAIGAGWYRMSEIERFNRGGMGNMDDETMLLTMIAAVLLPMLAIPFAAKLWMKWTGQTLTEAEKSPGMVGVRAWFGGGNFIVALLIPLCAWRGFDLSFWGILALTLIALLAYPVINPSSVPPSTTETKMPDLTPERERILKMLDDGKITAQESAELLNVLGHSAPPQPSRPPLAAGPHRQLVLVGGALLLVGFFLPWFGSFAGGDIQRGLGWGVLLLGLVAVVLPYLAENLDPATMWKIALAGLGLGAIILLYLLSVAFHVANFGIFLVLAGYALEIIGTIKQRPAVQR